MGGNTQGKRFYRKLISVFAKHSHLEKLRVTEVITTLVELASVPKHGQNGRKY